MAVPNDASTSYGYDKNQPISTSMSGPISTGSTTVNPWSSRLRKSTDTAMSVRGRDKGIAKAVEVLSQAENDVPRPSNYGYDSSCSDSLDSELGIPSMSTRRVKRSRYIPPHKRGGLGTPVRRS